MLGEFFCWIDSFDRYVTGLAEKKSVSLPEVIVGIVKCSNPACVSNGKEPVASQLNVVQREPLLLRCHYCGAVIGKEDVLKQF